MHYFATILSEKIILELILIRNSVKSEVTMAATFLYFCNLIAKSKHYWIHGFSTFYANNAPRIERGTRVRYLTGTLSYLLLVLFH